MPARSEPAAGSEKSWHQTSSAVSMGPRWRCFCSSSPWAISVGPSMPTPMTSKIPGTPARPISWLTTTWCSGPRPCPPYSAGQVTAARPASASLRCHSRRAGTSSRPGASALCSSSQARTFVRYSASSGVSLRSMRGRYNPGMLLRATQAVAAAAVLARLARGRDRLPPLAAAAPRRTVSVVVPARDEERRIAPCLEALGADPGVSEVIVVDDRSRDGTAALARSLGARVVEGAVLPPGWVGKPWALQQGLEVATGDVVVSLDADARPRVGLSGALDAALGEADWVTCGPRFVCDTAGERWLHPSMLAGLVYRFGPSDVADPPRVVANGQCTAVVR